MEIFEEIDGWRQQYSRWRSDRSTPDNDNLDNYPFVSNKRAPFTPARRALPMLNLGLISSAGAYIDGTDSFDVQGLDGDFTLREIPTEIEATDLQFAARGYDPRIVQQDLNSLIPLNRLFEFESNGIIGQLNPVFWSFSGFIPDAATFTAELVPQLVERVKRYEVQAALLTPASILCHQSVGLAARAIEAEGIPTMTLAVIKDITESVRPPRAALYNGVLGSIAGNPDWPEHQRRILDEALRLIEPMDQAGVRRLSVSLETQVQQARGER